MHEETGYRDGVFSKKKITRRSGVGHDPNPLQIFG
jgi:hypothetical protein